jgi:hypothetical protein
MATWTMQRSGNKSVLSGTASSPWYDGSTQTALNSKPGNGDTIVKGGFNITFDENTTIGSNTAGANAISGTGNVTTSAGVTVVFRGNIPANNSITYTWGNGAVWEFDASATTPTSTKYGIVVGYANSLVFGTGCEIRSNAGGGVGYIQLLNSLNVDVVGVKFTRMGDLNQYAFYAQSLTTDSGGGRCIMTDCTFDTCGMRWFGASIPSTLRCEDRRNTEINTVGTTGSVYGYGYAFPFSYINVAVAPTGSGTRIFENNVCRKAAYFGAPAVYALIQNCSFLGQVFTTGTVAGFGSLYRCLNVQNSAVYGVSGVGICGNQTDVYHVADSSITDNWHAMPAKIVENTTYTGLIFDAVGVINATDLGELLSFNNPTGPDVIATILNTIGLPSMSQQSGDTSYRACLGSLGWAIGAKVSVVMRHCTHYSLYAKGVDGAIFATGESFATRTGQSPEVQASIAWSLKPASAHIARDRGFGGYVINDCVTIGGHNAIFNGAPSYAGTGGVGYYYLTSATTAGTGDITADPGFVDPWRNIATWAVTLGYSGTNDQLLTFACEYISADCSLIGTRLAALQAYVRAGVRPTNLAYKAASYTTDPSTTDADGNAWAGAYPDVGAMAWIAGSSGGTSTTISLDDDPGFGVFASGTAIYF